MSEELPGNGELGYAAFGLTYGGDYAYLPQNVTAPIDVQCAVWARLRPDNVQAVAEAVVALLVQRGYVRGP